VKARTRLTITGYSQISQDVETCLYLDIRTYLGYDIAEYPDSDKILLAPSFEIYKKDSPVAYFDVEKNIREIWQQI